MKLYRNLKNIKFKICDKNKQNELFKYQNIQRYKSVKFLN